VVNDSFDDEAHGCGGNGEHLRPYALFVQDNTDFVVACKDFVKTRDMLQQVGVEVNSWWWMFYGPRGNRIAKGFPPFRAAKCEFYGLLLV
jgi:hypothetical protein